MLKVDLSSSAAADLRAILERTAEVFGEGQAERYLLGLNETLDRIGAYPKVGSLQAEIRAGLRRVVYRSHSIYYVVDSTTVRVARILGAGQDPPLHL